MRIGPFVRGSLAAASVVAAASLAMACTVSVKTKTKYRAQVDLASQVTWTTGDTIEIESANGSVKVVGDPNATTIRVSTQAFSFADEKADGDAAIADVTKTIKIDDATKGRFYITCGTATGDHVTAPGGLTGCDDLTVTVPAGSATAGLILKATAKNGGINASNLFAAAGQQILILSENGEVNATAISGGVKAHSGNGSVVAQFIPTVGANLEASAQNGDVTLSLPATFATDSLTLAASSGNKVTIEGFADLTDKSTSRGTGGASTIRATSDFGDVTLRSF